jgi:hypothetical protein
MVNHSNTWSQGYEVLRNDITISQQLSQQAQERLAANPAKALIDYKQAKDYSFRETIRKPRKVTDFTKNALMTLGYTDFTVCQQLQDLVVEFMKKFKQKTVKCRLDLTFSDSCRKFHSDAVHARAITTLIGPATEYKLNCCEDDEIRQVKVGETIILKGLRFPGAKTKILHKSPKISHLDIHRIVFAMDY